MRYNYKNLFASQHEKFTAILGQDYFSSLLVDDDMSDSAIIVTDKRVYQVGRLYEARQRGSIGSLRAGSGKKIVSLLDITGTSSKEVSRPLAGSALIAFGVLSATLGLLSDVRQSTYIMLGIALISIAGGVWLILKLRKRYLVIEYAGGSIVQPVKFITDSELTLFQGIIARRKGRNWSPVLLTARNAPTAEKRYSSAQRSAASAVRSRRICPPKNQDKTF